MLSRHCNFKIAKCKIKITDSIKSHFYESLVLSVLHNPLSFATFSIVEHSSTVVKFG